MTVVESRDLVRFARAVLVAAGARKGDAELCAEVLVAADLAGIDSHGVARLRRYVIGLRAGTIDGAARPEVVRTRGAVGVVDGHNGLGQPTLCFAIDWASARARELGASVAAVRRSNHIGIAGWYAQRAAERGMLAVVTTNATPQVSPVGAAEPHFGTNPISYAVPTSASPLVFDAATSIVPRGKLERLHREGRPMREGWALGPDGRPCTDTAAVVAGLRARAGYSLLPLGGLGEEYGGHKGSGLGLLVELLCGPLAGASWSRHTYGADGADLGHFVLCVDLDAIGHRDEIVARVEALTGELRAARPADGTLPVRLPGDRRHRFTCQRLATGVPLLPSVLTDLDSIAELTGVASVVRRDTVTAGEA